MWHKVIEKTLVNAVTSATTGAATTFLNDRSVLGVRYWITSAVSTTATVDIQGSMDGVNWAPLITQVSNPGTATTTGVISGPIKSIRAVTAGATHGTITVKVLANVAP
jgi:hypothetical protein